MRECLSCKKELDYLVKNFCPFCGTKIPTSEKFQNAFEVAGLEQDFLERQQGQLGTPVFVHDLPMTCTDELHLRMAKIRDGFRKEREEYPDIAHLVAEPSKFFHNSCKQLPPL